MISQSALARLWNVSQPRIAALVKKGMPLTSPEDAAAWKELDSQRRGRTRNAPTAPLPTALGKAARNNVRVVQTAGRADLGEVGAEHALKRLEQAEFDAATRIAELMKQAAEPGEPANLMFILAALKTERESWLKISESLRKFDLLIEENRRDSGQLIPREESEVAVEMAALWLRLAVRTFISSYVDRIVKAQGDHAAIVRLIEDGMEAGVNTSMLRCIGCRVPLQPWAIAAVRRGYGNGGDLSLKAAPPAEGSDDAD